MEHDGVQGTNVERAKMEGPKVYRLERAKV